MGIGDLIPDSVENKVEQGLEKAGEVIDEGGDLVAGGLDKAGWESGADWVRDKSDSAANALGADVDEMQLGDTEDPKKLIHGSPGKLRSTAGHLTDLKKAFDNVGKGLKGLDSQELKGEAADAFREKVSLEPKKWFTAADACEKAAKALSDFAGTVEWAQGEAKKAIEKYKKGKKASEEARATHNDKVEAYNTAVDEYNAASPSERDPDSLPPKPGAFHDPGKADVEAAHDLLKKAREQRNTAHDKAEKAVAAARDEAPAKPSYSEQLEAGVTGYALHLSHMSGGLVKGTAGVLNFARGLNPTDWYNVTHPAEYTTTLNSTAAGLVRMSNDPWGTAQNMWETFQKAPSEGLGRLPAELIGTRGLGSVKKVTSAARHLDDVPPGRKTLDGDGPEAHANPPEKKPSDGTDPVDLATGKMFLPQTDVALPGALPLVFRRCVESGYRVGRWFGRSWTSTADQRLEVDSQGVVFVSEDGRLLAYPHPAPGVPTLPSAGDRWPLERTQDGGYTLTDPDTGHVRHFAPPAGGEPDGEARIEQITDRNGHQIVFEYDDGTGAPLRIVHSGGYALRLATEDGRVTALSLAGAGPDGSDQVLLRYGYTEGNLTEVTGSSGVPLRFAYDDEARVVSWTDTNDCRYDYVYDNRDRCIAEGGTEGHVQVRIDYDGVDQRTGHKVTTLTTPDGHSTRRLIDDRCRVVAVTDPLGHTERFEYDAHGQVVARTDALGRTTRLTRDTAGRPTQITRPDGTRTRVTYDDLGLPVEIREPDGAVWHQEWDDRGNRTAVTDPLGHTTRYAYDAHGHLTATTNPLGETTRVRCDAAGLPVEITDPAGAVTRYERDAFGRPVAVTDPLGAVTRLEWTVEGRLSRRAAPDGAEDSWTYDGEGNCVRHVDAAGGVTTYEYTHFDLLAAQTGPDGVRHEFEHDTGLRLTRVRNPQGLTWSYAYDPAGRLVAETDFDGRTHTYAHDAAGQLVSRTTPLGETVTLERDALGQVVRKDAGGAVTTFAYDPAGRLTEAAGPDAEVRLQRDRMGRIKAEMVDGRVLSHSYDALGRRTRRVTPTGAVSSSTYDSAGNRTALDASGHTLDFAHDAAGRETARRIGDAGLALAQVWDPAGRLTAQSLTGPGAATIQQRAYTYRADGYLTGLTDRLVGSRSFDLDAAGRVTAVHAAGWTETYAYDSAGNQTHAAWPTGHAAAEATGPRTYTGTRIHRAGRVRYEHDDAGRVTLRRRTRLSKKPDTWHYTWDAEDRLTSVTTPDGTVWRYRYDPLGRRTAKQRLTGTGEVAEEIRFTWDGPVLVEQTTADPDLPHPVTLTWDHDGFTPLTQTERRLTDETGQAEIDARFYAIVTDLVGTPTELVDEHGRIAWHTRTTLWGTTTWNRDADTYTPLRFPGQYFDPESGLHYNFHRYYDPSTARYTSPDPLGLAPAPNPATYVDNPQAWTDVLGLAPDYGDEVPSHKNLPSRSAAFREAKRDLGIPMTQNPESISRVPMTDKFGSAIMGDNGQPIMTREYVFTRGDGSKVIIQDHAAGHQFGEGGVGDQGRHFNVRPFDNPRTGKVPGTAQHYEY
ncbi:putative T7SS-secreted protein [Streptomyces sp. JJ36]|uniref:putative T7SS-secreted protein n=1 Tax=Streptomyces sp. JJ36 TaxID=2736645 RepID=UPI001EECC651|nr:HNH/endonuclease VII fold putative polymorphic toxin [Streptomyces sp. JJ36]MCF6525063.1 RHS domain-containing protein [Streptomyces sp. JJ36]